MPSGTLWLTDVLNNSIDVFNTTTLAMTEYQLPSNDENPKDIARGPNNKFWFTVNTTIEIGMINLKGKMTTYPLPRDSSILGNITKGPNGLMWFIEGNNIDSITTS